MTRLPWAITAVLFAGLAALCYVTGYAPSALFLALGAAFSALVAISRGVGR